MRSIASARPVAGSMSIWAALNTTGPLPDLEPRRQRVDEARQDGRRVEPDHAPHGTRHAEVGLVRRPTGQDPLVAGHDVGVRADDHAHPPVEIEPSAFFSDVSSQWKSTRRIGGNGSGAEDSSSSASASVNGFSIGCM